MTSKRHDTIDTIPWLQVANVFVSANAFSALLFFIVVGEMLAPQGGSPNAERTVVTGFVLVVLYMNGSIQEIDGTLVDQGACTGQSRISHRVARHR